MYYELYIDILFMVNFMMDYLLLSLVREFTKCSTTGLRIFFSSIVGAVLTCIVVVLPLPYASVRAVLFHGVINTIMIISGFHIKSKIQFIKCIIFLYICGFLLGGVVQYFQQYVKVSSLFFVMAMGSYWLVRGIWQCISYFQQQQTKWFDAEVYMGEACIRVKALMDTGNGLFDPYTGSPVHVINRQEIESILSLDVASGVRYIPYHSIGSKGTMLAVRVNRIHLQGGDEAEYWIEQPLVALSEDDVSINKSYQMILNPRIL